MAPVVSGSGAVGAALVARKRRIIVRTFVEAGATSPETAKTLDALGLRRNLLIHLLRRRHVLVDVGGGRFYLDVVREQEAAGTRRVVAAVIALCVVLAFLALWRTGWL